MSEIVADDSQFDLQVQAGKRAATINIINQCAERLNASNVVGCNVEQTAQVVRKTSAAASKFAPGLEGQLTQVDVFFVGAGLVYITVDTVIDPGGQNPVAGAVEAQQPKSIVGLHKRSVKVETALAGNGKEVHLVSGGVVGEP